MGASGAGVTSVAELRAEILNSVERERAGETLAGEADALGGSLRAFIEAGWSVLEPRNPFVPNWHIDALCELLEAAKRREIPRLLLNVPPRHMKSMTTNVFWPVWWWTSEPHLKFLTVSYGEMPSTRDAVKSRDLLLSAWFQARWPQVQLKGDVNQKTRYENTATGIRLATTVHGQATGEGGDVIIIDDPHKTDTIESDAERAKVIRWYDQTMTTRQNTADGVEVLIMQRLHDDDLTAHALEHGGWEHFCLPAEYVPSHPFLWPRDERTEAGELLWPARFDAETITRWKMRLGAQGAAGQLQQVPAPLEGALLKRADWRYYPRENSIYARGTFGARQVSKLPAFEQIVHSWDTSLKDKTSSDFVSGQVWGIVGADRYLLHLFHGRAALAATIKAGLEMALWARELWPECPQRILFEETANGPDVIAELKREIEGVLGVKVKGDKVLRANAAAPALESGNCHLPGRANQAMTGYDVDATPAEVQQFVEECASFPYGSHDDQVDAWSQMINWTRGREGEATMSVPTGQVRPQRFLTPQPVVTRSSTRLRPTMR